MDLKKTTVRIHPVLWIAINKELEKYIDNVGVKHVSMNSWIVMAIKEKIERDKII